MNTAFLVAFGVIGFLGLGLLFVSGITDIRDLLTHTGWLSTDSWLAKMTRRAEVSRVMLLLQALGIDQEALRRHQSAEDSLAKRASDLVGEVGVSPDVSFLRGVPSWTYELEPVYTYRGSPLYVDLMGAMYLRRPHEVAPEQIFASWLALLRRRGVVGHFDCLIAPKEGNPLFARAVAQVADIPLIVCKGPGERSRIERPADAVAHQTDFEGLHAFLQREEDQVRLRLGSYRALAIDDSCKGGSQICGMAARFNQYVSQGGADFEPITDAVTLFRVKGPKGEVNDTAFRAQGVRLHALVALGPTELRLLKDAKGIDRLIKGGPSRFKQDPFGCEQSKLLLPDRAVPEAGPSSDPEQPQDGQEPVESAASPPVDGRSGQGEPETEVHGAAAPEDREGDSSRAR